MEPFTEHTGVIAVLDRAHVDTDQIIPKQFLKSIRRTGYGPNAFFDWRYDRSGKPDPAFELNAPHFANRSILLTGSNFGCGSSREHAVWALLQDGYRALIAPTGDNGKAPGFADIFRNNAVKNGLLTIELPADKAAQIARTVSQEPGVTATVDLPAQTVTVHAAIEQCYTFTIDHGVKERLLKGLDDIAISLGYAEEIRRYEHDQSGSPWDPTV